MPEMHGVERAAENRHAPFPGKGQSLVGIYLILHIFLGREPLGGRLGIALPAGAVL